jgi:hypothetical protein
MKKAGMNRRQFLQASSVAVAGTAAAVGTGTLLVDPGGAWAMSLQTLNEHAALTLLKMTRDLYPHDRLGDVHYAKVVESLDQQSAGDEALAGLLKDGVGGLDGAVGGVEWVELSDGYRLAALKEIEATPFFQTVRGACVTGIYNSPDVWRVFGYEGASAPYGGYLERGFDDLAWLDKA